MLKNENIIFDITSKFRVKKFPKDLQKLSLKKFIQLVIPLDDDKYNLNVNLIIQCLLKQTQ